jgi:hypothetical protein
MKRVFLVGALFIFTAFVRGADLFELGNAAYQSGDFKTAQGHYEALIAEGRGGGGPLFQFGERLLPVGPNGPRSLVV